MKKHALFIIFLLFTGNFFCMPSHAANNQDLKNKIGVYLNLPPEDILIECKGGDLEITPDQNLKFCLNKSDTARRCEVSLHALKNYPEENTIDFDFKVTGDIEGEKDFFGIFQIHSFPDRGESWRCPPFFMSASSKYLNFHNRWDANRKSITSGNNCTEVGSTIESTTLMNEKEYNPNKWYDFSLLTALSYDAKGHTVLAFNGEKQADIRGPNMFNDKRTPFIKLGIYKPTSWRTLQNQLCVEYRNIKINLQK